MSKPDLIKRQRHLLDEFKTNNQQRINAEAEAKDKYLVEKENIEYANSKARQDAKNKLDVLASNLAKARAYLTDVNLKELLTSTNPTSPAPSSDANPETNLENSVNLSSAATNEIVENVTALIGWYKRRTYFRIGSVVFFVFLCTIAAMLIFNR